jgi:hypothetical protein
LLSIDADAALEKRLEKLRLAKGATPYGQGSKAEKANEKANKGMPIKAPTKGTGPCFLVAAQKTKEKRFVAYKFSRKGQCPAMVHFGPLHKTTELNQAQFLVIPVASSRRSPKHGWEIWVQLCASAIPKTGYISL